MPRIRPINREEADAQTGALFDNFQQARGNVPNMYRTLAHRPEIASTLAAQQAAVMSRGTVPALLKELIAVRVSQLNQCAYCIASHSALVERLGGSKAQLAALADFEQSAEFDAAAKAALRLAEQITRQPEMHMDDQTWQALSQHYDAGQIVEIVCAAAIFNYFNRINNYLDIEITR